MEIKIPREVRNYHESIFFGLSFRQFICSTVAIGIAVIAYFGLRDTLGNEGVSWVCILTAVPVASLGFITYHGMTLEHFVLAYIKSEFLMPKELVFKADNYLYLAFKHYHELEKMRGVNCLWQTALKSFDKLSN